MKRIVFILLFTFAAIIHHAQNVSFNWVKQIGGTDHEICYAMARDALGNIHITGEFIGTEDFDPGPGVFNLSSNGSHEVFISKLDANGNFVWAKQLGGIDNDFGNSISIDASGNVYTAGLFSGTADFDPGPGVFNLNSVHAQEVFVSKLDANGNFIWAKQLGGMDIAEAGSSPIVVDASANVYTASTFTGTADFDPGVGVFNLSAGASSHVFVSKLDANGNFVWAKQMEGIDPATDNRSYSIVLDASGNLYTSGYFHSTVDFDPGAAVFNLSSFGGSDAFISKLDANGNFIWAIQMGGTGGEVCQSTAIDASGNIYSTGVFSGQADFDPGPGVSNISSGALQGAFVSKLDANGNYIWVKHLGEGSYDAAGGSIAVDAPGNVYTTGSFYTTGDFDPGACVFNLISVAYFDIYITKLDAAGNFIWAKQMGGAYDDYCISIAVDASGNVYTAGAFAYTVDFDPGNNVYSLSSFGQFDAFVHKMSPCTNSTSSTITVSACAGYTLNCQVYTSSGVYTQVLSNAAGCDSIITLNLTINNIPIRSTITASSPCNAYIWNGQAYTTSGTYTDTLVAANGCDSIITLNLTINNIPIRSTITASSPCNSYIWNGQTYTTSGTYTDTLVAANGCDSIVTLNLTINNSPITSTISAFSCKSYIWNNQTYTTSGTYTDTLIATNGCDSLVFLQLTINPISYNTINQAICEGQNFEGYTATGVFIDTFIAANGCDSIRNLQLTVNPKPLPDLGEDKDICAGDSVILDPGPFSNYIWHDGSSQNYFIVKQPGIFSVMVANNCGTAMDEVLIKEGICDLRFPSAFTPNNDGNNDLFKALGVADLSEFHLSVYNRWGQKTFETNDYTKGWAGDFRGRLLETGVYVWYCRFKKSTSTEIKVLKGTILLIR